MARTLEVDVDLGSAGLQQLKDSWLWGDAGARGSSALPGRQTSVPITDHEQNGADSAVTAGRPSM